MSNELLTVSASPHVRTRDTSRMIMLDVIIALVPSLVASVVIFGFRALAVTLSAVISCVLFEWLSRKAMKRHNTIGDLSAVVTGMILGVPLTAFLYDLFEKHYVKKSIENSISNTKNLSS